MTQDTVQDLQKSIQVAKEIQEAAKALERLLANRDFQLVIQKGYFEHEAVRLVHLKSDPLWQSPQKQADILRQIDAIGALSAHLSAIRIMGDNASKQIADDEGTLEELAREEAGQ